MNRKKWHLTGIRKALLLGAGFVVRPTIEILAKAGVEVTVGANYMLLLENAANHTSHVTACRTVENAKKLCDKIEHTNCISLDVFNESELEAAIEKVDIVISLIPYSYHATVAKAAIKLKKNMVTTSYISPALADLEESIKEAGITIMNEIGLDPGIDHLYAVKTIDEVHREGGKILSFISYCGGLPAPGNCIGLE